MQEPKRISTTSLIIRILCFFTDGIFVLKRIITYINLCSLFGCVGSQCFLTVALFDICFRFFFKLKFLNHKKFDPKRLNK